jgi:hypothetical protein
VIIGASRVVGQCDPAIYSSLNTAGDAQGVAVAGTVGINDFLELLAKWDPCKL